MIKQEIRDIFGKHPKAKDFITKYIKYNFFGLWVFVVSSFVYWLFGSGGWLAFIMAGGIGGLFEFTVQLHFVYGEGKLFERINPSWKRLDDLLHGRDSDSLTIKDAEGIRNLVDDMLDSFSEVEDSTPVGSILVHRAELYEMTKKLKLFVGMGHRSQ